MNTIYSDLRKNVHDAFRYAGVNLVSPHFIVNKIFDGDKQMNQNTVAPESKEASDQ